MMFVATQFEGDKLMTFVLGQFYIILNFMQTNMFQVSLYKKNGM